MTTLIETIQNTFGHHQIQMEEASHSYLVEFGLRDLMQRGTPVQEHDIERIMDETNDSENVRLYHVDTRSNTKTPIGRPVSSGYTPHTLEDIVALATTAQDALGCDARAKCHWSDGHFLSIQPTKDERLQCIADDSLFKRIRLTARYGGLSPLIGNAGLFRDRCTNLMEITTVKAARMAIRHTANLPNRVDELLMKFNTLTDSWQHSVATIDKMASNRVNLGEYVDAIWNVDREELEHTTRADNRAKDVLTRYRDEGNRVHSNSAFDVNANGWQAFNAVQGYVQHKGTGTSYSLGNAFSALDNPRVKRAEELALA